ncbi:lysozyme inhibitor LprI family protein [Caballeronia sp. GaOx3]|uniref:lysozyme inhibitor LprI family protein n=1 Tax=Caballeronia sp. GaOx3 TaxID=2921740 RepID=UPI0020284FC4|nr:lysozyme inhibitor LprI family protein [Caballeronia sp. GaOx3]
MQTNQNQPIWNPSRVASLSFIFTPVFGSYLQGRNWQSLGHPERAASSKSWFCASLLVLVVMAAAAVYGLTSGAIGSDAVRGVVNLGALAYFAIWYGVSGRQQVQYVKEQFGKDYAKKSLVKPLLAAVVLGLAYIAVIVGILIAALGSDGGGAARETSHASSVESSNGPSFSLASFFGGGNKLDCASPDVRKIITDNYADQLVEMGIPDLVAAVESKRIGFRVDTITETGRNTESQFVNCKGNLVITFPAEDLAKARKVLGDGGLNGMFAEAIRKTGPVFNEEMAYRVSIPADKEERKNGPVVEFRFVNARDASDSFVAYGAAYGALAYTAPDISASSNNTQKWSKEFKDAALQACGKQANLNLCQCRLDEFERLLSQEDMQRIGYLIQSKSLDAGKYPNFIALSGSLSKQCPNPASTASAAAEQAAAVSASTVVTQPASDTSSQTVVQQDAPKAAVIEASFDCGKAASKIEKLICSTPETADSDRRVADAYRAAASKSSDPAGLKQQQRDWLKERNACDDAACLMRVTDARVQVLSAM